MDIKIRDAALSDVEAMTVLLSELFRIETDFFADRRRQRRGLCLMLSGCRKHRCIKVAEANRKVVGMCTAQILVSTAEGGLVGLIEDMVVAADFRGRGVGRLLMAQIEEWAHAHALTRLQLLADRTNFSALEFYDKVGWHPTRMICLRRKWHSKK